MAAQSLFANLGARLTDQLVGQRDQERQQMLMAQTLQPLQQLSQQTGNLAISEAAQPATLKMKEKEWSAAENFKQWRADDPMVWKWAQESGIADWKRVGKELEDAYESGDPTRIANARRMRRQLPKKEDLFKFLQAKRQQQAQIMGAQTRLGAESLRAKTRLRIAQMREAGRLRAAQLRARGRGGPGAGGAYRPVGFSGRGGPSISSKVQKANEKQFRDYMRTLPRTHHFKTSPRINSALYSLAAKDLSRNPASMVTRIQNRTDSQRVPPEQVVLQAGNIYEASIQGRLQARQRTVQSDAAKRFIALEELAKLWKTADNPNVLRRALGQWVMQGTETRYALGASEWADALEGIGQYYLQKNYSENDRKSILRRTEEMVQPVIWRWLKQLKDAGYNLGAMALHPEAIDLKNKGTRKRLHQLLTAFYTDAMADQNVPKEDRKRIRASYKRIRGLLGLIGRAPTQREIKETRSDTERTRDTYKEAEKIYLPARVLTPAFSSMLKGLRQGQKKQ